MSFNIDTPLRDEPGEELFTTTFIAIFGFIFFFAFLSETQYAAAITPPSRRRFQYYYFAYTLTLSHIYAAAPYASPYAIFKYNRWAFQYALNIYLKSFHYATPFHLFSSIFSGVSAMLFRLRKMMLSSRFDAAATLSYLMPLSRRDICRSFLRYGYATHWFTLWWAYKRWWILRIALYAGELRQLRDGWYGWLLKRFSEAFCL